MISLCEAETEKERDLLLPTVQSFLASLSEIVRKSVDLSYFGDLERCM
jgi:hypothetical protein